MRPYPAFSSLGDGRYREEHGPYYDDLEVGDIIEHRPGRTVTEADNMWQSLLAMNQHPLHIDAAYAATTEFGRIVVSSLVSLTLVGGMTTNGTSARAIANLGWSEIRLLQPLFVGETIYAETRVLAKRRSNSRPDTGIITFQSQGVKSTGEVFITFTRAALMPVGPRAREA